MIDCYEDPDENPGRDLRGQAFDEPLQPMSLLDRAIARVVFMATHPGWLSLGIVILLALYCLTGERGR